MGRRATKAPTTSAGNKSSDWPMLYQLCSLPPRPCTPNSGNSLGNTSGSEVHQACAVWRRWVVSAEPSQPEKGITKAASEVQYSHYDLMPLLSGESGGS